MAALTSPGVTMNVAWTGCMAMRASHAVLSRNTNALCDSMQVGMEVDAPQQAPTAELGTSGQEAEQGQAQAQEQPQEQPQAQQPQEQQQQGQQQQGQEQQGKAQEQAPAQPPMSKNKMKKLAKLERYVGLPYHYPAACTYSCAPA